MIQLLCLFVGSHAQSGRGLGFGPQSGSKPLHAGTYSRSTTFDKGEYYVPAAGDENAVAPILLKGDNLVFDFKGVRLLGSPLETDPDKRSGVGILVTGNNITIRNLTARGYKVALMAHRCKNLKILDSDLSYNWKQHLNSTPEKEDESDWMSYHHNEANEWLRYGAGIYLQNCDGFEVARNKITGGQCGLLMRESNGGKVWNNDFSFLSGLGLGMYRSSENTIMHNKFDWCVRGYSHGVYSRGQDSSGILIYEQSNKNVFAYNSATHGGDGFFLWAGQSTMDSGVGGCNDNLLYGNDFSHATANAIEATFSRNKFVYNKLHECDHGVWGGYSFDTLILANEFRDNNNGISIEHGQHNVIRRNWFWGDKLGIHVWQNASQDPNWGYPKHHDTVSHDYTIESNIFVRQNVALSVKDSAEIVVNKNRFYMPKKLIEQSGTNGVKMAGNRFLGSEEPPPALEAGNYWDPTEFSAPNFNSTWAPLQELDDPELAKYAPKQLVGGMDPFLPADALRGRKYIIVDEWGPYDWRSPKVWARSEKTIASTSPTAPAAKSVEFEVMGPAGNWKVASAPVGVVLTPTSGKVGDMMTATYPIGKVTDLNIQLEYVGAETTDGYGRTVPAGQTVAFGYRKVEIPIDWKISFFKWDAESDPRTKLKAFEAILKGTPVATSQSFKVDFSGYTFAPEAGADHFATVCEGTLSPKPGEYTLEVMTDDGCRVWFDGEMVIKDAWHYQGPTQYKAIIKVTGTHKIRVEHFQIDGYAQLKVNLKPVDPVRQK